RGIACRLIDQVLGLGVPTECDDQHQQRQQERGHDHQLQAGRPRLPCAPGSGAHGEALVSPRNCSRVASDVCCTSTEPPNGSTTLPLTSTETLPVEVSRVPIAVTSLSRPSWLASPSVTFSAASTNAVGSALLPAKRKYDTPSREADWAVLRA